MLFFKLGLFNIFFDLDNSANELQKKLKRYPKNLL